MTSKLPPETFSQIIRHTPLVSIDLIVEDEKDNTLLGLRHNAPAKGFWFVPGGRIYKGESLAEAMRRISRTRGVPEGSSGGEFRRGVPEGSSGDT